MLHQISPSIYISDYEDATDRPCLGYIHGSNVSVMIDAGNSSAHALAFLDELKTLNLPMPQLVILTHWHWDHVYGLHALNFSSICTHATQLKLIEMASWNWDDASMAKRLETHEDIEFCDTHIRVEYPDRSHIKVVPAQLTFDDHFEFQSGHLDLHVFKLVNDHADDSCVILIPQEKILFVGDIFSANYHEGEAHYTHSKLSALIKGFEALDFELAIHGHTEPYTKAHLLEYLYEELELLKVTP